MFHVRDLITVITTWCDSRVVSEETFIRTTESRP